MSTLLKCLTISFLGVCASSKRVDNAAIEEHESSKSTPNILFILMDDMGYGDTGARGSEFSTPNIDSLYSESIVMNRHYIGLVCSPTRAQLLTGRFAWNFGTSYQKAFNDATLMSMPAALPTLANLLNDFTNYNSYATGKWQLGSAAYEHTPLYRGFKHFYGFYTSGITYDDKTMKLTGWDDFYIDWWVDKKVDWDTQYDFSTTVTGNKIKEIINSNAMENEENNENKPFFIYAAFQAVHESMDSVSDKSSLCTNSIDDDRRTYCENIMVLDDVIGDLVDYLKDNDYWDNTMIIFTSDNGGPGHTSGKGSSSGSCNYPLRGAKGNFFEGGVRTISFVGGGYISEDQRGTERDELFHVVDWVPTILSIAGADVDQVQASLQDTLYLPIAQQVAMNEKSSLDYVNDYWMQTSLDGIDLSQWLLYGSENSRDHVPLSVASYEDNNSWDSDESPTEGIALVFTSSITGKNYKFMYLTEPQTDVIRRSYCTNSLCDDKDSIAFARTKLLFELDTDESEEYNLFEMNGNLQIFEKVDKNMKNDIKSEMFWKLENGESIEYSVDVLDSLYKEAMSIIASYKDDNVLFNDVLGCQMNKYYDDADPENFEVQAIQPFFTWDEYVTLWKSDCKKQTNSLLMELFTTKWTDWSGDASYVDEMGENIIPRKQNVVDDRRHDDWEQVGPEPFENDKEREKEQRLNNNIKSSNSSSNSKYNLNNFLIGAVIVCIIVFGLYRYFAGKQAKIGQFNEYTPLRMEVEA